MQNDDTQTNNETAKEVDTVEIDQEKQTAAMTGPSVTENPQVSSSQSFGLDVSCSDDDEVSEVDSFILENEDTDPVLEPNFLLPQTMESANLHTVTVDPETHARLEALLEAAGIGKLSTADGKALTDPEVLRKLTSSVSCALDEAAQALHRMRAEQQSQLGNTESQRSLAEACSDGDVPTVRKLLREGGSVHETTEEGDSLLSLACSAGYYELAQVLLAMKANVEDRGIKGDCTPLMEAASGGYVEIVKLLIAHLADVNAQSSAGNTPLHYAACGGYEDVVQVMIEAGANVEQHNENGHTPLMEAASAGHVGVAAILLNNGAGINTHSNEFKESALTLACYKGHLEMVKFLLEAGADQEHKTDEMHTALMEASMDGHVEVARLLLDSGAQVNMPADSFESPLTLAACGGHVELANLLIERGANLEEVNDEGYTPLMEAAREGHEEMVALLLAHDADINAQTEETQETALTLACCGGFLDVADFLISAGADIELGCSTPLMEAAQEGHLELVKYLLKYNAKVNAITGTGDTALTYACENGHTDVADVLLEHGAELEHESEGGRTPLMKAARAGHLCTVQFLIGRGADVNRQTTTNDHTVLSLACAGGHLAVVELLLACGADPTHKLKDGSTMVIEAAKGGHTNVVKLLLEYPNRVIMNHGQELPPISAADSHHVESRVPIHGLANIVPPSEPDSHQARPNNLTTATCEHMDGASPVKRKAQEKDVNISPKTGDQIWQNVQKSLKKSATGNQHNIDPATKNTKSSNLTTSGELAAQISENGVISDLLPEDTIDLKAGERLEAIISNVMAKELINTTSTREEQILRKQQILEELQKVEKELQEKAQQQWLITVQQQHQQQQQLQQVLQPYRQPLHQVLQKELESQKKKLPVSSQQTVTSLSTPTSTTSIPLPPPPIPLSLPEPANNLDKQPPRSVAMETSKPNIKPNISERPIAVPLKAGGDQVKASSNNEAGTVDKQKQSSKTVKQVEKNGSNHITTQESPTVTTSTSSETKENKTGNEKGNNVVKSASGEKSSAVGNNISKESSEKPLPGVVNVPGKGGELEKLIPGNGNTSGKTSTSLPLANGPVHSQNGGTQLSQAAAIQPPRPPLPGPNQLMSPFPSLPASLTLPQPLAIPPLVQTPAPAKPPQLTLSQQQQLEQQLQQLQLQQQQAVATSIQQQPATVLNQPFVLNENQRQTLQNLILRQQQEAQQLAQQTTLQFPQLQFTPQQQEHLFQVISQQQFTPQQLQQVGAGGMVQQQMVQQQQQQQLIVTTQQQVQVTVQQHQTLLQQAQALSPQFQQMFTQQHQQLLQQQQQQQQTHFLQQQLQNIKPPVVTSSTASKPIAQRKTKSLLPMSQINPESKILDIETVTPPPSTPLTPNPSPASPDSISPLYTPIDLDAQTESNHDTALTLACAGGHSELVTLLLNKGADIEHRDKKGFTPLILAATAGHTDVVEILLENGADIEAQSERTKDTPLSLACSGGRYEVVELLLCRGANKEHRNVSDYTPLSLAASGGFVNIIKLLLSHGAEINSRTGSKLGISPLMLAAMNGHTAAVKLLLDMGSDINAQIETNRNTALTLACFQGRHEVVSLLVDRRANIEHRAKTGLTPLMEAASGGYVEVGRVLLDKGGDVNAPPVPSSRDTALTIAADKGHYRFVELLLSRHSAVDVKNKKGNSPLWLACNGGHLDVVQLLVTAGADIDSQDNRKVSCLMAAFRKGHIKVVKWMVKHVSQFPSDTELSRYIATVADKELQKKCQQCFEIIVHAKERQAAEAFKNAKNLLEELDKERQEEESRKAAAAKKREKKKNKKKNKKQEGSKDGEQDSLSKNSSPEPESEDSVPQESEVKIEKEEKEVVLEPPTATTTSTLGLTLPTSTEPIYSKSKGRPKKSEKRGSKNESEMNNVEEDRVTQDENQDPRVNNPENALSISNNKTESSRTENKKNKKNRRERDKEITTSVGKKVTEGQAGRAAIGRRRKGEKDSSVTAIGDLDDFGNLPSISDRDMEKIRKTEKPKGPQPEKTPYEKAQSESSGNQSLLSVKASQALVNSPKRGQRKEDGWKEVIRKSKKVQVPASAISRVIGRGGSNINAIREVSGANIDVEKNKGSGERTITIKGSAEATRQAHALITALITDPDKELAEIIPKSKQKPTPSQVENKSLYFIPPNDNPQPTPSSQGHTSGGGGSQKPSKTLAPRLQQQAALNSNQSKGQSSTSSVPSPSMAWGGTSPAPGSVSPRRSTGKNQAVAPYSVPSGSMNGPLPIDKSGVTRQLFSGDGKRMGFGTPGVGNTKVTMSTMPGPSPSSPPTFNMRQEGRQQQAQQGRGGAAARLVPGTVKVLQRPSSSGQNKHDLQPLPIVPNQSTTTITTHTVTSANSNLNMSSSGEFSPFNNLFSNATEHFLGKKDDINERMNFASVAAAGVVSSMSSNPMLDPTSPDAALQAKAPGFKPPAGAGPRMPTPMQDMNPAFRAMFPMPNQFMDMGMQALHGYNQGFPGVGPSQPAYSNQSPNMSPRSSQSSTAGLSPRSNSSGFDPTLLQKEEYTTPNQPMTLPKISSSLNPNAPDFTSRSLHGGSSPFPGQGAPPPFSSSPGFQMPPMYNQELAKQLMSVIGSIGPGGGPGGPQMGNLPPSSGSPIPGAGDTMGGMPTNQQELFQNMANLMHQLSAVQSQVPSSPGLGPNFTSPMVPRPFSPLPGQGRPSSAPSVGGMLPREGPSPTPIGPPRAPSPVTAPTPPMSEMIRPGMEDRRQPRPIGGERTVRKPIGPVSGIPGTDYGDAFWNFQPQLNMDWNPKIGSPVVSSASLQTSVISTSVIAGSTMATSGGEGRSMGLDSQSPGPSDDLNDQGFPQYVQSSGLPPMTLFNGVGPYQSTGFGNGAGDNLQSMWSTQETSNPDDRQKTPMWNWNDT
ncbi:ankyrin repeat domain-containing protein 17-like isoform X2 [Mya arenaria]|uniref:ankyrin repeat domain-containing protein 17-like isoform X2 n=1 Tax=Mya arenaria TaxID=6604 RepID=UPI0022E4E852|nr:ankyrin repeat domain-containing protein 17-like isoform X2 [Mya arenaria]